MIDFDSEGVAWARFKIISSGSVNRKMVEITLSDLLAYVKASETMEELRVHVMTNNVTGKYKAKAVGA